MIDKQKLEEMNFKVESASRVMAAAINDAGANGLELEFGDDKTGHFEMSIHKLDKCEGCGEYHGSPKDKNSIEYHAIEASEGLVKTLRTAVHMGVVGDGKGISNTDLESHTKLYIAGYGIALSRTLGWGDQKISAFTDKMREIVNEAMREAFELVNREDGKS